MAWNDDAHIQDCLNRDYDPLDEVDELDALEAAADAELCAGCGHFLPLAPDGYCGQCEPPAVALKPIAVRVQLPKRIDESEVA
jgi:hypothetical protein